MTTKLRVGDYARILRPEDNGRKSDEARQNEMGEDIVKIVMVRTKCPPFMLPILATNQIRTITDESYVRQGGWYYARDELSERIPRRKVKDLIFLKRI
jgi:hypothetical protein